MADSWERALIWGLVLAAAWAAVTELGRVKRLRAQGEPASVGIKNLTFRFLGALAAILGGLLALTYLGLTELPRP